jgi:hypothetical protein
VSNYKFYENKTLTTENKIGSEKKYEVRKPEHNFETSNFESEKRYHYTIIESKSN